MWIRRRRAIARLQNLEERPRFPVNCIVFSKNRAMQLDACLRTIEMSAPYTGEIVVIFLATTPEFADGYGLLAGRDRVRLVAQGDSLQRDVIAALDRDSEYTVFHTDDDVYFRKPTTLPVLPRGFAAFSLRLGENTTYCYPFRRPQEVPATFAKEPFLAWDWTRAEDDFSYPISLNGHILRTRLILEMLSRKRFTNPNELEDLLHAGRYLAPPMMLAFRESCLVSIPANVVTATHTNRAAEHPELSAESLNARFLSGDRIDVEAMDFSIVRAAHQEIAFAFKSAEPKR